MLDRRTILAGSAVLLASRAAAGPVADAKRRAIEAVELPAGFNGVLAYGRRGRIVHARRVGFADVEARRPVTPETRFKFGSASKWLASVAVLRLAEQRRLSIDAPIATYLPDFRPDTGERVRLVHLLSNTSGIPDLLTRQIASEPALRSSSASAAEIVARFGGGDLMFEPGQGWDYAALNWVILAAIVERLTGEAFADTVGRLVLRPLGLTNTGFAQLDRPPLPHLAAAYGSVQPPVRKMLPSPGFIAATGNVAGTAADAIRAAHGIFHGSLIGAASRTALTTVRWPEQDYALGGRVHVIGDERWAWETGKVQGYRAHIAHRLSASETVVVFNTTDLDQGQIARWVEAVALA
ncbi:serine hydrolase domain-containing protein [Sphingomonas sp. Y38-1Y]|uniref:serine hydrolase domain-containing protein n=1 Tax=Sphingomonas sp. Y38-1Y TaxID=3078265 RepID=UPI0028EE354F|nr:serine hydrolase domain-containing protein [Sphingomonas sp. Y38-1Y]